MKIKDRIRLNKNEKRLLIILFSIILLCFFNRTILINQKRKIVRLEEQKNKYEEESINAVNILKEKDKVNKNSIRLGREKNRIALQYFSCLEQSEIIYLLDDVLKKCKIEIFDIDFSAPKFEMINGISIKSMDLSISYQGTYEELLHSLNKIINSPKKILINSLVVDRESDNVLIGEIELKVYSLEGILNEAKLGRRMTLILNPERKDPFLSFYEDSEENKEKYEDELQNSANEKEIHEDEMPTDFNIDKNYNDDMDYGDYERENTKKVTTIKKTKKVDKKKENKKEKRVEEKPKNKDDYSVVEDRNGVYLDLRERNINMDCSKTNIEFWLYSYNDSSLKLELSFLDEEKKEISMEVYKSINSEEWNHIKIKPPKESFTYPLKLDKMYFEFDGGDNDFSFILIDGMNTFIQ